MSHASSGRPAIIEVIDLTMEKPAKNPTTAKPPKQLVEPPTHKPATNPARKPAKQKLEMDSMVQTKLDGFACMRPHVARQELLDSGRRSKKKSKKKKHKRQHTRHKPASLALASSTTTIIVHRYAFSSQTARQSKRPVGSGKLKLKRPMGTGKLKLKLKHKPTSKTQTTSQRAEQTKTPTHQAAAVTGENLPATMVQHYQACAAVNPSIASMVPVRKPAEKPGKKLAQKPAEKPAKKPAKKHTKKKHIEKHIEKHKHTKKHTNKHTTNKHTTKKHTTKKHTTKKPAAAKKPAPKKPATKKPATKKPQRKTPTRKQPARAANTRLSTYNDHARTVRLCCKGTGARECRIGADAYQATIPELQCRSELVNDSQGLEQHQHCTKQHYTDKSIYTTVAYAWKIKGSQQQLLVEKQAGLIGPYHSSILGTSDSDEEYGGTHWRTAATMRWAQHVE